MLCAITIACCVHRVRRRSTNIPSLCHLPSTLQQQQQQLVINRVNYNPVQRTLLVEQEHSDAMNNAIITPTCRKTGPIETL